MTGRPPIPLTPELVATLCEAISAGYNKESAAEAIGVHEDTLRTWLKKGRRGDEPYSGLFRAVKKAEAEAVNRNVRAVQAATEGGQLLSRTTRTRRDGTVEVDEKFTAPQWTAAAWWLERTQPEKYSDARKLLAEAMKILREGGLERPRVFERAEAPPAAAKNGNGHGAR